MKRLLFVILLGCASTAHATYTIVTSTAVGGLATSSITTGAINASAGNLNVVCVDDYANAGATPLDTVTDSNGNVYTATTTINYSGSQRASLFYSSSPTNSGSQTFTVSCGGGQTCYPTLVLYVAAGAATSSVLDQSGGAITSNLQTVQPGSITPTNVGSLLVTCWSPAADNSNLTINSGFSTPLTLSIPAGAGSYLIETLALASNPTWSWTTMQEAVTVMGSFNPGSGGGGSTPASHFSITGGKVNMSGVKVFIQ
jgi:hypothetical protein